MSAYPMLELLVMFPSVTSSLWNRAMPMDIKARCNPYLQVQLTLREIVDRNNREVQHAILAYQNTPVITHCQNGPLQCLIRTAGYFRQMQLPIQRLDSPQDLTPRLYCKFLPLFHSNSTTYNIRIILLCKLTSISFRNSPSKFLID